MHVGRRFVISMLLLAALFLAQSARAGSSVGADKPTIETAPPEKTVYLTFDDGPSEITLLILDVLKEHHVPATFFACGNVTEFGRNAYKRILDEGHALGNHTFYHRYDKIYASADAFEQDVARLDDLFYKFTDTRPRLPRFPGGSNKGVAFFWNRADGSVGSD